jgi:hypothetical protein
VSRVEFFFALEFFSQGAPASLLGDLASQVLDHVGCVPGEVLGLTEALQQAVEADVLGTSRCDVQFRAQHGMLDILVSSNGGRIWQTSRPIR